MKIFHKRGKLVLGSEKPGKYFRLLIEGLEVLAMFVFRVRPGPEKATVNQEPFPFVSFSSLPVGPVNEMCEDNADGAVIPFGYRFPASCR